MFLPQCQRPSFTSIQNNRQNYSSIYLYVSDAVKLFIDVPYPLRMCTLLPQALRTIYCGVRSFGFAQFTIFVRCYLSVVIFELLLRVFPFAFQVTSRVTVGSEKACVLHVHYLSLSIFRIKLELLTTLFL